jgi:hypothetical protein
MTDLKPPLTGFSLWFMTSGEHRAFLQSLIQELSAIYQTPAFEAHATLIGLLEREDESVVMAGARELARVGAPFEIEIIGTDIRDHYFQSVFLTCAPAPEAVRLNARARSLFHHEDDPPLMLHWSAVYGDLDAVVKQTIKHNIDSRLSFPRRVPVAELAVVNTKGYPPDWNIVQRFPLIGKPS